ncbi:MAG: helix-turn-helix transcriptional regulator [Clostridium sp.]|nr:helix-turn-helix transcriptional regulator [Clostridium sp.]
MNSTEILLDAMKERGYTQTLLAKEAGYKRQSNVSEILRSKSMQVDNFVKLLNTMGFDVIVKDRTTNNLSWVVGTEQK